MMMMTANKQWLSLPGIPIAPSFFFILFCFIFVVLFCLFCFLPFFLPSGFFFGGSFCFVVLFLFYFISHFLFLSVGVAGLGGGFVYSSLPFLSFS
jgi:hypothetical protein